MNQSSTSHLSQERVSSKLLLNVEHYLPWLLPLLLLLSRSVADISVLLVGLLFLFRSYQLSNWQWAKQPWFLFNILFWLYLLFINAPLSINPIESLTYAFFYLRWPLFAAALAYWLLIDTSSQQHLLIALLSVCAFIIFDTSLQYFIGHDLLGHAKASATRLTGPYSRPVPGIMMLRVLFIGLFLCVIMPQAFNAIGRIIFTISMLCMGLLFVFITGERMALMLFFTGSIVVLTGLLLDQKMHISKILIGLGLLLGLFTSALILNPEMAERSVFSIGYKLAHFFDSDYGLVFRAAYAAWQQTPILGSGFHTYQTICNQMGLLTQWGMQCSHPHNLYLQIAAECGLIGLMLFVTMIGSIYFSALQHHISAKQWLITSLSLVVLSVCFWPLIGGISILNNGVAALVWLGVGWVLSTNKTQYSA